MMGSNNEFALTEKNYYPEVTKKLRIIIGNIPYNDLSFFTGWKLRYDGQYKNTCHYTIDNNGIVRNHFSTDYYSSFMGVQEIDKETISIGLLNLGWARHNVSNSKWLDWMENEIKIQPKQLIQKQWREYKYWHPYENKQIKSLVKLLKELTEDHGIERLMVDNNTLLISKKEFWPISFISNYFYYRTDVTPAFPFDDVISRLG